eukprot:2250472-Pleurochrysis_carterae.AAC.4
MIKNDAEITQADKAIVRACERSRRHRNPTIKEEEEFAKRQMISGIIPEWKEVNDREKKGTIALMKLWTGEMMNRARIQMQVWVGEKNEQKAKVQQRLDNRRNMYRTCVRWKKVTGYENKDSEIRKEKEEEEGKLTKIYGIKLGQNWDDNEDTHTG